MARSPKVEVPKTVHDFLSEQGKKGSKIGGSITKRLIEEGKRSFKNKGQSWRETETRTRKAS